MIPADPDEIAGIEARAADERAIDVRLRHDRSHVVGIN
jgi:hypothetical protein